VVATEEAPTDDVPAQEEDAAAELEGDADAIEREILDLSRAELSDALLLSLPGSEGIAVGGIGQVEIPEGGTSVGTPQRGALRNGVQLPFNPGLYTRRDPSRQWGSTHTIRTIQSALTAMREQRGVYAPVIIGDVSRPHGGRFRPHVSHQSGRDVDIRLIVAPDLDPRTLPVAAEHVDWDATWALVESFLETGTVKWIFLSAARQPDLYEAGRRAGVHEGVLQRWFRSISHEDGHRAHLHIRLHCGPGDPQCR
jgi:murein endopeptidase